MPPALPPNAELRERARQFITEVRSHEADFATEPDVEWNVVRMTAAAMLGRSLDLLEEAFKCADNDARDAAVLVLRVAVELTLRARFLLTHPEGVDEHRRMVADWDKRSSTQAQQFGVNRAALGHVLNKIPQTKGAPRNLAEIARLVDRAAGHTADQEGSVTYVYRLFYGFPSMVVVHAGLGGIKRYTWFSEGRMRVIFKPQPLTEAVGKEILVAGLCGELATEVFDAFGIDGHELERLGVRMPRPEELPDRI